MGRKRGQPSEESSDLEMCESATDEKEEKKRISERKQKSGKKSKKDRKRRKRSRRSRSRSPGSSTTRRTTRSAVVPPEDGECVEDRDDHDEGAASTDVEGGCTPPPPPEPIVAKTSTAVSLSVEETNNLRSKLGLAPLKQQQQQQPVDAADPDAAAAAAVGEDGSTLIPGSDNVRHKPAENLAEKSHADKMRQKLEMRRQKRRQESKLLTVKKLADDDSDAPDDASRWVKLQKDKSLAAKRAKMLEEMDEQMVDYSVTNLEGLKVEHSADRFADGGSVILTLKDADVLSEERDTLVNVNLMDDEKVERNLDNIKKAKIGYNKYDQIDDDDTGRTLLHKYDEEIDGRPVSSFVIGKDGQFDQEEALARQRRQIKEKLARNKNLVSLQGSGLRLASDYLTKEEIEATKFKKPKKTTKRKKRRKMLKADDLLGGLDDEDHQAALGSRNIVVQDDDDPSVRKALDKAKKARRREDAADRVLEAGTWSSSEVTTSGAEFIGTFADDDDDGNDDRGPSSNIILNETSEFCRHLGAWQASEAAAAAAAASGSTTEVSEDILEFEESLKGSETRRFEEKKGRWAEVVDVDAIATSPSWQDVDKQPPSSSSSKAVAILDEEPDLAMGVAGAIKLAKNKGYLELKEKQVKSLGLKHLQAKNYSIDDKVGSGRDDERGSRHRGSSDHRYGGPSQPFQEKSGYVPKVDLQYVDESGRKMNEKEAFRHLSHRFHGKGSGKIKTEKRMKKVMEESMMRNMSSTDTPLNTLAKLRERQQESATPYVVLTGSKNVAAADLTDLRK